MVQKRCDIWSSSLDNSPDSDGIEIAHGLTHLDKSRIEGNYTATSKMRILQPVWPKLTVCESCKCVIDFDLFLALTLEGTKS